MASSDDDALSVIRSMTGRTQASVAVSPERVADFLRKQDDLGGKLIRLEFDDKRRRSGASSGTQLVDAYITAEDHAEVCRKLVFRYDLGGTFFFQYDLVAQFRVMKALRKTPVPVPKVLWLDAAGEIAGLPGLFMERVDAPAPGGQPFAEGPLVDAPPEQRRQMILESVRTFARLHQLDPKTLPLDFLGRRGTGADFIARAIDWDSKELMHAIPAGFGGDRRAFYDGVRGELLGVRDYLFAHAPKDREPEIAHGDPNLSNLMFRGSEVAALLDWELCHLGLGEADLAYCLAGMAHFLLLMKPMAGVPSDDDVIAAYKAERGSFRDWEFCRLWGEWRLGVYQAMGFSRLPPDMQHVEEMYWNNTKDRLGRFMPREG